MATFSVILFLGLTNIPGRLDGASNGDYLVRGTARTMMSTMEIPRTMVEDSRYVPFPFGLVTGALRGAFRTVLGIVGGAADLARGAAPYAKYAILFA